MSSAVSEQTLPSKGHTSATSQSVPLGIYLLVAVIFFFSGSTALIYEVIWTRHLTTFFGSTLYGVATVLSAFMGGLALGSLLIGRRADRMRNPLAAYGLFEIGIGIAALVFPHALEATQPIIGGLYATGGDNSFLFYSLVRFVIVFILLMVPTTLMGATLPVMSKAITSSMETVGKRVGGLYALNTAGAVLGVFAAGFYLLENIGVFQTTLVAAVADFALGGLSIVIGGKFFLRTPNQLEAPAPAAPQRIADETDAPLSAGVLKLVLLTYMASGFVALAYQVCWTRALIFSFDTLKSTTYSFSGMLLIFLLGLAIGSAIMQAIVDRQQNLLRLYALLQGGIGLGGGLSYFVIQSNLPTINEIGPDGTLIYTNAVLNVMQKTALAIGLPTLLMGMAFPVVTKIVVGSIGRLGGDVARVYALNTIGAILGSFCAGFILIPTLGITGTLALLTAVNMALAAVLSFANVHMESRQRMVFATIFVIAAVLVPARVFFSGATLQRIQANEKTVHYEEGAMATISVVENNSGDRMIYVDDVGVAGTDKIMLTDQKSLAHVPMMLLGGQATNVLSVGFGSGGASFSYTLYPGIENIHTIEIAPEVLRAAPTLTDSNHGIIVPESIVEDAKRAGADRILGFRDPLDAYIHTPAPGFRTFDPRFRVLIDDARSYLRFTDVKYDVIATDCTDLRYKSNANLYDLQYFQLCREAITENGLVVVWMPLGGLSDRAFRSALRTFEEVFPEMSVWYFTNQPTHYCLLIGGNGRMKIDYDAVVAATGMPQVVDDLEEIGLRDPDKLLSSFVCDERTLHQYLKGYPLNTENHPIIEFESPRYGYDSRPLRDNQWGLYEIQVPVADLITGANEATADHIWKLQQANFIVFEGHVAYRLYDFRKACQQYMDALAMVPDDVSIERLLDFAELRRHYDTSKQVPTINTVAIGQGLAEVFFMQGRLNDAVTIGAETARMLPPPDSGETYGEPALRAIAFGVYSVLAKSYAHHGNAARAEENLGKAKAHAASDNEASALEAEVRRQLSDAQAG